METLQRLRSALGRWLPNGTGINPVPHEHTYYQSAKLVRAHRVGELILGHYQSDSEELPDCVTTQVVRGRSATDDEFETVSWTVTPATPAQLQNLSGCQQRRPACVDLLALSDPAGNIVLSEFLGRSEAERAMAAVAAAEPSVAQWASARVATYPVTREEVRLLAAHWTKVYLDAASWCVRHELEGTAEEEARDYSTDRVLMAQAVLGRDEIKAVEREVHGRYCRCYYEHDDDDGGEADL